MRRTTCDNGPTERREVRLRRSPCACKIALNVANIRHYSIASPTFSPDGSKVAWAENDGIHVANTANPDDCTSITQRLLIPGGAYPYFANANAAAARLALSAPTKAAKLSKRGALAFHITANANATATASGTISIRKAAKVRFAKRTVKLVAGKRATVTLRLSKKNVRAVRKALKKAKLTARITLVAKGASGGAATKRLALRLQP